MQISDADECMTCHRKTIIGETDQEIDSDFHKPVYLEILTSHRPHDLIFSPTATTTYQAYIDNLVACVPRSEKVSL